MNMKMIMALVNDEVTDQVIDAARKAGATGATVITSARGEGLTPEKTFLGLDLAGQRDIVLFLVAATRARAIIETIGQAGEFDTKPGAGIAFQISIEDVIGLSTQLPTLLAEIEGEV